MCNCETTYAVTGPDAVLDKLYGDDIKRIREAFEDAIAERYVRSEHDGSQYIYVNVEVEDALQAMFKRIYESAGWPAVSFRYMGEVRLYIPDPK